MWFRECNCHTHDLFENILPVYLNEWGSQRASRQEVRALTEAGASVSDCFGLQQAATFHTCLTAAPMDLHLDKGTRDMGTEGEQPRTPE